MINFRRWRPGVLLAGFILAGMLSCSSPHSRQMRAEGGRIAIDSTLDGNQDTAFLSLVNQYKGKLDSQMTRVIAQSDMVLSGGKPESLLTNYIADMYLDLGRRYCEENGLKHSVDLSIVNVHGLRTVLPKGSINVGKIFELMPFENRLVVVSLPGDRLNALLNHLAEVGGEGVAGMKMGIKDGKAINVMIGGKPLDVKKDYYIVSIDYLIRGGSGMKDFKYHKEYIDMNMKCREAILEYVEESARKGKNITSKLDGRIYHEQ
ncbi:MAG: 5'-nucleotidase C-terminal domain-containing protein [Marinifilaceae bacterium]